MNKKSFFFGVFVGVLITWALSFYLYYSLNQSQGQSLTNTQKNVFNFDSSEESQENHKQSNLIGAEDEKKGEGKLSYFKKKLSKEKDKRKVSRKLVEELMPITVKQSQEFGLIKSADDQFTRDEGYKTHAFNVLVSKNIGSFRDIPDTRHKL